MAIHDGHRQRMRKRFEKEGLANFEAHEVLELMLYYCIPRADTNEIAHKLIRRYGTIDRVLQTSPKELQKMEGIGENASFYLALMNEAIRYINVERATQMDACSDLVDYRTYLKHFFDGLSKEAAYLLCLDAKGKPLGHYKISEGSVTSTPLPLRDIVEIAITSNAASVILAHNHPGGLAIPSEEDKQATVRLLSILNDMGIILADHIVFSGGDYISLMQNGFLRDQYYR